MPRSPIRAKTIDAITDDGAILFSVVDGEQIQITITLDWITDLTGYTITAKIAEALNVVGDGEVLPLEEDTSLVITTLPIIDDTVTDGVFKVVITEGFHSTWDVQPAPDDPVYGFFALSIEDSGVGSAQQKFVPIRGLVEVRYNPLESI